MPQLDFSTFPHQIFWLAVTFCLLYFVVSKFCLPTIREVLQNRQSRISSDIKNAEMLKEQAKESEADFNQALAAAKRKAGEFIANAREKVKEEEAKRHAKLDENFEKQQKEAEQRVARLKIEAKEKLLPLMTESAIEMLQSLSHNKVDKEEVQDLIKKKMEA